MKQLLCLSHIPWQARPNRTQQLLARMNDVQILFFEPAVPRNKPQPEQGRQMRSHITVYTLPAPLLPGLGQRSVSRAVDFISKTMSKHHFRDPVLWCTSPEQSVFMDRLACRGLVYDCHREWGEEFLDRESDLVCRAEVVFAASPGLVDRLSPCSDNIALLPNGVNHLMFSRDEFTAPPWLVRAAPGPVLGRVGDLNSHVELAPLLYAAHAQPSWTFVLMGRVTKGIAARLSQYKNIVLTGPVNAVELPDHLNACRLLFDLLRTDRRGCDIVPSHIYEYLASGKPIVMMAEPEQVEPFPAVIYTAYDSAGFLRRCRRALEEEPGPVSARRREYAQLSSWANRAAEVTRILEATGLF